MRIVENKLLVLRTKNPSKFEIIPRSAYVGETAPGVHEVAVYWGLDEIRVLRNLGVKKAPSPILRSYPWPGLYKPMAHQRETAAFLSLNKRALVLSEPGTGKTSAALWAADYLMRAGKVRRCLIVCPISIMRSAWMQDLTKTVLHRSCAIAHSTTVDKRRKVVQSAAEFVITNYDGLHLIADEINENGRFDLVIADEATAVKTTTTRRWKALRSIIRPDMFLWLMTGTPAAQSPLDAYGLGKLVNPENCSRSLTLWKDAVMRQVTQFKWVPKDDASEKVHRLLQPAIRFTKAECLDLPPVVTVTREVLMTPQQKKYYKMVKEQMLASAAGETITAINKAAVINKLLQISAGAAYSDSGEVIEFDCAPRLAVLDEVLQETERKVLVFAHYRHSIDTIMQHFEKHGVLAEQIHGGISATERPNIISRFQADPSLRVLVMQPQAAAHGITLTAADTVVFWSPIPSVEHYIQCIARADRHGQTAEKVTVIHLESNDLERQRYKQLQEKIEDHEAYISLYEQLLTP